MKIITCPYTDCDNNTGFTAECMFGVTPQLIEAVRSGDPICPMLKESVLQLLNQT